MADFEEVECDICGITPAESGARFLQLGCCHSYCIDCSLHYIRLGGPSRKLTFNHLFCPFRCGTRFQSDPAAMAHPELGILIMEQTAIMNKVSRLAIARFKQTEVSKVPNRLTILSELELEQLAMEQSSYYMCDFCEDVFWEEEMCCAAGSSEEEEEHLCSTCKLASAKTNRRRQVSPAISLWREMRQKHEAVLHQTSSSQLFDSPAVCNSDYNAGEQSAELEVLQSIYPESIDIMTSPPAVAGEPCALYVFKIPSTELNSTSTNSKDTVDILLRLMSQIRIVFKCTSGYPSLSSPLILLQVGDLSMLELTSSMKSTLRNALMKVVNDNVGNACAYACFAAAIDWMESVSDFSNMKADLASRRELEIQQRKIKIEEAKALQPLRELCKKSFCRQCYRCGYGPVFTDICADLTAYHGSSSFAWYGRGRIDNSCPNCYWFAVTWYQWPAWDGKFMFEREEVLVSANNKEKDLTPKERERFEKQNLNCLVASLKAHAKQCGACGYGPVLHHYCDMLGTHHGESVSGGKINNACPQCGWFASEWSQWKPWTGKMYDSKVKRPLKITGIASQEAASSDGGAPSDSAITAVSAVIEENLNQQAVTALSDIVEENFAASQSINTPEVTATFTVAES